MTTTLDALPTPCLILDEARMTQNIARIHGRLADTGVSYRAHLKTAKSIEVARRQMLDPSDPRWSRPSARPKSSPTLV